MKTKLKLLLVNLITTVRMGGIFILIPIYLLYGGFALGIVNIACFLTDFVDGKLARKLNASTFFGSIYDGIADKLFLAVNFIILCSITPLAIIPILFELGIISVQSLKFKKNYNVQSSIFGKAKMWVAGITVVLSNFLIDIDKLQFLGTEIISKIGELNESTLVAKILIPLILAEVLTLTGYIMEFFKKTPSPEILKKEEKNTVSKKNIKGKKTKNIINEKKEIIRQEKELLTLKQMLFDPDFYNQHKDESGLKLLKSKAKKK